MKTAPKWAQDLIIKAVLYLNEQGIDAELPEVKWRNSYSARDMEKDKLALRKHSSGVCHPQHITIVAGKDRKDLTLVLLHELAHWAYPLNTDECEGHEGHTPRFWDTAWKLYRWAKLPVRYCLTRERTYRKGAVLAYKRSK